MYIMGNHGMLRNTRFELVYLNLVTNPEEIQTLFGIRKIFFSFLSVTHRFPSLSQCISEHLLDKHLN